MFHRGEIEFTLPSPLTGKTLRWINDHIGYHEDDCIVWPFARNKTGYGNIWFNGKYTVASRVMCEKVHGLPPDEGMDAAHSCGNGVRGCMNPKHLSWKTRADNEKDKDIHGTRRRGEDCNFSRLTWDIVRAIRSDALIMSLSDISLKYGISKGHAWKIYKNKRWDIKHDPEHKG